MPFAADWSPRILILKDGTITRSSGLLSSFQERNFQSGDHGTDIGRIGHTAHRAHSTHGYVAAQPPLGAADTGGQVVYVLELAKKLGQLGHKVDIYTRRFEEQPEFDTVDDNVRVIRIPCGGPDFIPKEYLHRHLGEWNEKALRYIKREA